MVKQVNIRTIVAVGKELQLSNDLDRITWRWTSNGECSAKVGFADSAHRIINLEGSCRGQARENGLVARCVFCAIEGKKQNQEQETATHLVLHFSFGKRGLGKNSSMASRTR
jgi:hypothetical protein